MDSETEFYHSIANISIYVAEGILGLAAVAVAKSVIWPPLQYVLREKWDWQKSKRFKKPAKVQDIEMGNFPDEAGGPKSRRCWCEHEVGCKKSKIPMPDDNLSEGKHVSLTMKEVEVLTEISRKKRRESKIWPGDSPQWWGHHTMTEMQDISSDQAFDVNFLAKLNKKVEQKKKDLTGSHSPMMGPSNDE